MRRADSGPLFAQVLLQKRIWVRRSLLGVRIRNLATKENILVPTGVVTADLLNGATQGPGDWADKVYVACTDIMRQCVARGRKDKGTAISTKINQRLTEHILSMEEVRTELGLSSEGSIQRFYAI